jgi:hypothetical protein
MKATEFCTEFNSGDPRRRARVFRRQNLKEADVNLLFGFPPGGPGTAIVFAGYLKVKSAVWYIIMKDERRVPGKAFQIYRDAETSYEAFIKTLDKPDTLPFLQKLKPFFIEEFTEASFMMVAEN